MRLKLIPFLLLTAVSLRAEDNPQLAYQTARAEAAEARAELAEAAAAVNLAQLQAASATIDYLRKYNDLKATKDAKDRALEALKAKLEPQTAQ